MKKLLAPLSILALAAPHLFADAALQAAEKTTATASKTVVSLQVENDIYFSDRYYTNGIKLNYTSPSDDWWATYLQFQLLKAVFPADRQVFQTASLGQDMKVGIDITNPNPPADDHPYSGWLYLSAGANLASENRFDSLTVTVGLIGDRKSVV